MQIIHKYSLWTPLSSENLWAIVCWFLLAIESVWPQDVAYSLWLFQMLSLSTTTILRPFVWYYPGEPVPKETFTHSHMLWWGDRLTLACVGAGKLLERSQKIAYNLHKVGSKADGPIKPGHRVCITVLVCLSVSVCLSVCLSVTLEACTERTCLSCCQPQHIVTNLFSCILDTLSYLLTYLSLYLQLTTPRSVHILLNDLMSSHLMWTELDWVHCSVHLRWDEMSWDEMRWDEIWWAM